MVFTVLVAGGGIGGLAFAKAILVKAQEMDMSNQVEVKVVEKRSTLPSTGHGLTLFEGIGVLDRLGLLKNNNELAQSSCILTGHLATANGKLIHQSMDAAANSKTCSPRGIRRADLVQILLQSLPNEIVQFDWEIIDIQETNKETNSSGKIKIKNQRGEEMVGDVLVGFDGIQSRVRAQVNQQKSLHANVAMGPKSVSMISNEFGLCSVLLGTARYDELISTSVAKPGTMVHRFDQQTGSVGVYFGQENGSYAWTIGYRCPVEPARNTDWNNNEKSVAAARKVLNGWSSSNSADDFHFLLLHSKDCMQLGVYARSRQVAQQPWSHGRMVTGGDAAHAVLPLLGEGANLAICDAAVLARHLLDSLQAIGDTRLPTEKELSVAFGHYEIERRPPSDTGVSLTRWLRPIMLSQNSIVCWLRNLFMKHALDQVWKDVHLRGEDAFGLLDRSVKDRNPHANIGTNIGMVMAHLVVVGSLGYVLFKYFGLK